MQGNVFGCLDQINCCAVRGWVVDSGADASFEVSVWLDGVELRRGQASALRTDVAREFGTSGWHGFALTFRRVAVERLMDLEIRYRGPSGEGQFPMSEAVLQRPQEGGVYSEDDPQTASAAPAETKDRGGGNPRLLAKVGRFIAPGAPGPLRRDSASTTAGAAAGGQGLPLFFVHIPKTAGTSFRRAAEAYWGRDRIFYDYGAHSPETASSIQRWLYDAADPWAVSKALDRDGGVMLGGHAKARKYAPLLGIRQTVAFVRDPVARLVSEYRHWWRYLGFEGGFEDFYRRNGSIDRQSRYLDGIPCQAFGFVGVSERYAASLAVLNALWGVGFEQRRDNQDAGETDALTQVSQAQAQEIYSLNAQDTALHQRCLAQLEERQRLHEAGARYAHGQLLLCRPRQVTGWAWWEWGDAPVTLAIYVNDQFVGVAQAAELSRHTLPWGPPRAGYVGFRLPVQAREGDAVVCQVQEQGQILDVGEITKPKNE